MSLPNAFAPTRTSLIIINWSKEPNMKEEIYYKIQTEEPICIDVPYLPLHRKKSWKCEESNMDENFFAQGGNKRGQICSFGNLAGNF